ncbi:hypothetical protein [Rhodohalobacter sp. SW132]|uniref:hypothetical protein n=1 Tax=Rhodohalobacter sp. SW132 TaxID=2293433 RepID=UPI000E227F44|nr:hypothetical protein [Rhodohalobacter sp. SW132]
MKKLLSLTTLLVFICTIHVQMASAQSEGIVPDRPGYSTGTFTVPVGQFYVESGYQFSFRNSPDLRTSNIPALTVRTGLSAKSELFLEWDGVELNHSANESDSELPLFGAKFRLKQSDFYEFTLIGGISGSKNGESFVVDPLLGLMWETELSDGIEHFGGIQIESETDGTEREWLPAFAAGLEFELSGRFNSFVEYYTIYSGTENELYHATELGLLYYPVPNIQIDFYGGIGFSNEIPHYVGTGISFLFN